MANVNDARDLKSLLNTHPTEFVATDAKGKVLAIDVEFNAALKAASAKLKNGFLPVVFRVPGRNGSLATSVRLAPPAVEALRPKRAGNSRHS